MSEKPTVEIIKLNKRPARKVTNLSDRKKRAPPPRKPRQPKIIAPVPIAPSISTLLEENLIDNTKSTKKRDSTTNYATKHSNFLITFVPNTSVREEINPELYNKLKEEIKTFARYILDPANREFVLKPAAGNSDKAWLSKVIGYDEEKLASIEDSKDTNKRLHTHIYLPVTHKTKIQLNLGNIREIANSLLKPLGITNPHINAQVELKGKVHGARDYVKKLGDGTDGEIVK